MLKNKIILLIFILLIIFIIVHTKKSPSYSKGKKTTKTTKNKKVTSTKPTIKTTKSKVKEKDYDEEEYEDDEEEDDDDYDDYYLEDETPKSTNSATVKTKINENLETAEKVNIIATPATKSESKSTSAQKENINNDEEKKSKLENLDNIPANEIQKQTKNVQDDISDAETDYVPNNYQDTTNIQTETLLEVNNNNKDAKHNNKNNQIIENNINQNADYSTEVNKNIETDDLDKNHNNNQINNKNEIVNNLKSLENSKESIEENVAVPTPDSNIEIKDNNLINLDKETKIPVKIINIEEKVVNKNFNSSQRDKKYVKASKQKKFNYLDDRITTGKNTIDLNYSISNDSDKNKSNIENNNTTKEIPHPQKDSYINKEETHQTDNLQSEATSLFKTLLESGTQFSKYLNILIQSLINSHKQIKVYTPYPYDLVIFLLLGYYLAKLISLFIRRNKKIENYQDDSDVVVQNIEKKIKEFSATLNKNLQSYNPNQDLNVSKNDGLESETKKLITKLNNSINNINLIKDEFTKDTSLYKETLGEICENQANILMNLQ